MTRGYIWGILVDPMMTLVVLVYLSTTDVANSLCDEEVCDLLGCRAFRYYSFDRDLVLISNVQNQAEPAFRFTSDSPLIHGPALVVGMADGRYRDATLAVEDIRKTLIWA